MDRTAVFEPVRDLIADITDVEEITEDSSLYDELAIDSVDLAELVFACEEEFGVSMPDDKEARAAMMAEVKSLETVGDIVDYIVKYIGSVE